MEEVKNLAPAVLSGSALGVPPREYASGQIAKTTGFVRPGQRFDPAAVRYIKLGENGKWATNALEQGTIPFGYRLIDHGACVAGNWAEVRRHLAMGRTARGAGQGVRELKDFYVCLKIRCG